MLDLVEQALSARDFSPVGPETHHHGAKYEALQGLVDTILQRMIFDGEALTDLMEPLGLNWKARRVKELDLMADLMPLLLKRAGGREISGLSAYEQ